MEIVQWHQPKTRGNSLELLLNHMNEIPDLQRWTSPKYETVSWVYKCRIRSGTCQFDEVRIEVPSREILGEDFLGLLVVACCAVSCVAGLDLVLLRKGLDVSWELDRCHWE